METMIELPASVLITAISVLCAAISTMALTMWGFMKSRLKAQDTIIEKQGQTILALQEDVKRLSKGCGIDHCVWKIRA